jgi:hypothetical protein
MLDSTLALLREELALKLARDFALRLDELDQLCISHVVKVARLADLMRILEFECVKAPRRERYLERAGACVLQRHSRNWPLT